MKSIRLQLCVTLLAAMAAASMLVLKGPPPRERLSQAACFGDLEQVERCVDWGVDVDAVWGDEWPPLLSAIYEVHLGAEEDDECPYAPPDRYRDMARYLVVHGADVTSMNSAGQTPLHSACMAGSVEAVTLLLDGGARMEARDFCGDTPLEYAAQEGHADVVDLLVRRGAAAEEGGSP